MRSTASDASELIGLPVLLVAVACVPGLNAVVFSGHGGLGWILLFLSFPLLLINTYRLVIRPSRKAGQSPWIKSFSIVVAYLLLAFPCGLLAANRIAASTGLPANDFYFYRGLTFPVGLVVPPWHESGPHN